MLCRRMRLEDKEREEGGENVHNYGSESSTAREAFKLMVLECANF